MKLVNPEGIKSNQKVEGNMQQMVEHARAQVGKVEFEASQAKNVERQLELEYQRAKVEHEKKKEAENHGQETKEKINEVAGGVA